MMNLCKTLPLLLFFVLLSACAPVTTAPTATLQPTASPAPTQPPCSTVASEPTPIPGVDSRFPAVRAGDWIKGPPNVPVTIIVYNDFQCIECNDYALNVIAQEHPEDVRLVYRHFPQAFSFHNRPRDWNGSTAMLQRNAKDLPAISKHHHAIQYDKGLHL